MKEPCIIMLTIIGFSITKIKLITNIYIVA